MERLIFYDMLKSHLAQEYGANYAKMLPIISAQILESFVCFLTGTLQEGGVIFQLLWIALALGTAWKLTRGIDLSKRVLADVDVNYDLVKQPSVKRNIILTIVGVLIIYGLFLQLSMSPTLSFNDITRDDVSLVRSAMEAKSYGQLYFKALSAEAINTIESDLFDFIHSDITNQKFIDEMERIKKNYSAAAMSLAKDNKPEDFEANSKQYPDLCNRLIGFVEKECRLNYYYFLYTTFFDPDYNLQLDSETINACDIVVEKYFTVSE